MTGPEHYAKAEKLVAGAEQLVIPPETKRPDWHEVLS